MTQSKQRLEKGLSFIENKYLKYTWRLEIIPIVLLKMFMLFKNGSSNVRAFLYSQNKKCNIHRYLSILISKRDLKLGF
ncbi:hypothetical protein AT248_04710 [Bartonella henselae]|nr:hypothetical protein BhenCHDE101_06015 [Bartonella henselae]PNM38784.1 hypothetical protein AL470_005265 [Bartonella henselae str. Houston-1]OLL38463.1 hypothetical protein AT237_01740 [Bartonella henselae]OLL41856.1 hypothetical protein AT244_03485 [Bartonella henselae]OLL45605.1 hypothetical protein AT242_00570 [Bartonella henselae]